MTWNVSFITSQYGAISGAGGVDNVTITAPTGTVFPNDRNQYRLSPCPSPPNVTVTGSKVVVHVDCPIAAASDLTVQIADVTNPSPGTLFSGLSVSTQTDPIAVSDTSGSAFTTPQTVSSVHFTASTLGANATGTVWQWRFTASSTGWLTHSYIYAFDPRGQITLTGPPGTTFSTDPNAYTVTDLTTGATGAGSQRQDTFGPASATINLPDGWDIHQTDQIQVTAGDVTNPASGSESLVTLSTSSDPTPQSDPTALGSFGASGHVSTPIFTTTTTAAGATNVTWGVTFATSATGAWGPQLHQLRVRRDRDHVPGQQPSPRQHLVLRHRPDYGERRSGADSECHHFRWARHGDDHPARNQLVDPAAGDLLHVSVFGATNPPSGDFSSVGVSTTSDIPVETIGSPPAVTPAAALTAVSFSPSSPAEGVPHVNWTFDGTASLRRSRRARSHRRAGPRRLGDAPHPGGARR